MDGMHACAYEARDDHTLCMRDYRSTHAVVVYVQHMQRAACPNDADGLTTAHSARSTRRPRWRRVGDDDDAGRLGRRKVCNRPCMWTTAPSIWATTPRQTRNTGVVARRRVGSGTSR